MSQVPDSEWRKDERRLAKLIQRTKEPGGLGRIAAAFQISKIARKYDRCSWEEMGDRLKRMDELAKAKP